MGNKKSKDLKKDQAKDGDLVDNTWTDPTEDYLIGDTELEEQFKHKDGQKQPTIDKALMNNPRMFPYFQDKAVKAQFEKANIYIQNHIYSRPGANVFVGNQGQRRLVAIKIVNLKTLKNEETDQKNDMMQRQKLKHPRIISYLFMAFDDKTFTLVMDYAARGSLNDVIKDHGPFSECIAMVLFNEILKAVAFMHDKRKLAHRNIKLEHILLTKANIPKLTGFKYVIDGSQQITSFVGDGVYLPPEVLQSEKTKTPYFPFPADVWSLGVCLFYLTNNGFPFKFTANSPERLKEALITEQLNKHIRFRDLVAAELSQEFKNLVRQILEPDTGTRATVRSLKEDPYAKLFHRGKDPQPTSE